MIMTRQNQRIPIVPFLEAAVLALTVAGCGVLTAKAPSSARPHARVSAAAVTLQKHLKNSWWYPPAVTKHYPTTEVAYHVPSPVGMESWQGNPESALLTTLNHVFQATTVAQVMAYSDPSFWGRISKQWQFPRGHRSKYGVMKEPLTAQNVQMMPATDSPYAAVIRRGDGDFVLTHSWAIAVGEPGNVFSTWYKKHPALTPWLYFVDVRGHWLLYSIQN